MLRCPRLLLACLPILLLVLPSAPARAHAIVLEALPANNAVIHGDTFDVRLRFNNRIDRARSRLLLLDAFAKERPVPIAADAAAQPDVIEAHVSGLSPGQYRLRWQVLALDGHITHGDIAFTVVNP